MRDSHRSVAWALALATAAACAPASGAAQIRSGPDDTSDSTIPISLRVDANTVRGTGQFGDAYPSGSGWGLEATFNFTDWVGVGFGLVRASYDCDHASCLAGTGSTSSANYGFLRVRAPIFERVQPWVSVGMRSSSFEQDGFNERDIPITYDIVAIDRGPQLEIGADIVAMDWIGIAPSVRYRTWNGRISREPYDPFEQREVKMSAVELRVALVIDPSFSVGR